MTYSASTIAKTFIALSDSEIGDIISNLKLQKLLYYAQGYHLAMYNEPLFSEDVIAWRYGPVVPDVYQEYKHFGSGAIQLSEDFDSASINSEDLELIQEVFNTYGQFSALKLMNMTHEEMPWKTTQIDEVISREKMKDFFINYIEDDEQKN